MHGFDPGEQIVSRRSKIVTLQVPGDKVKVPAPDANILTFYMGKNTPERKDYIMENLVVPVED